MPTKGCFDEAFKTYEVQGLACLDGSDTADQASRADLPSVSVELATFRAVRQSKQFRRRAHRINCTARVEGRHDQQIWTGIGATASRSQEREREREIRSVGIERTLTCQKRYLPVPNSERGKSRQPVCPPRRWNWTFKGRRPRQREPTSTNRGLHI